MPYPYASDREEILSRLRKIEGQIRGIQRMVQDDTACVDVLTQVSAVVSGMQKVSLRLLRDHMQGSLSSKGAAEDKVDEVIKTVERFLQT